MIGDKKKVRLTELDSLRGIACLMVFFFHHSIRFVPEDTHYVFHYGYMGVPLFFMISGFVIFLTLERSNWLDFTVHRLTRLYPAYWICVFITFFTMNLSPYSNEDLPNYLLYFNLTMLQHWIGVRDLELAYWTLNFELSFYAFMVIMSFLGLTKRYIELTIVMLIMTWLHKLLPGLISYKLFEWFTFFTSAQLFAAGIIFYHIYKRDGKALFIEYILLACCLLSEILIKSIDIIIVAHLLFFFFIFFLLTKNKLKWIAMPVMVFYGQISYSFYLIHETVGLEILKLLKSWGITNWYLTRSFLLLIFTVVCYLISYHYEQPLQKWLNGSWKELKTFSYKVYSLARS